MEFQIPFNFIAFSLFLATLITLSREWKRSKKFSKLPPGPWKLPLIGNLHNLRGSLPHHSLTNLARKHGSLMHLQLGESSAIVISSPRLAKEALKTHDLAFANRPKSLVADIISYNSKDMAFSPYGDYWRQVRKICFQELLSAKNVSSLVSIRQDEVSRLVNSIGSSVGKSINLTDEVFSCTNSIVCREAFGKVCRDQETFLSVVRAITEASVGFDIADVFPSYKFLHGFSSLKSKLLKMHSEMDMMFEEIISEHIKNRLRTKAGNGESGQEDLIDVLLRMRETDELQFPLTNDHIKAIMSNIFNGGTDTSSTTVDWAMVEMIRNPQMMAKAQSEVRKAFKGKKTIDENDIQGLKYLKSVIKETLRVHPPAPLLFPRECREECEIDGYTITIGTKVIINFSAIGKDPEYWQGPERFEPERFEESSTDFRGNHFEYIPFGAGRRICPGMSLAIAHIELPLALLLYHFNWKLPNGINISDLDMTDGSGVLAARKDKLYLIPSLYDPSSDMSF